MVGWFVGVALFGNRLLWRVVGVWDFALLNPLGWVACWVGVRGSEIVASGSPLSRE